MAKATPLIITSVILVALSLAATTLLKQTSLYGYAGYINFGITVIVVLSVYRKLRTMWEQYERSNPYTVIDYKKDLA